MTTETQHLCTEALIAACRAAGSLIEELACANPEMVHRTDRAIAAGAGLVLRVDVTAGRVELRVRAGDEERPLVAFEADRPSKN